MVGEERGADLGVPTHEGGRAAARPPLCRASPARRVRLSPPRPRPPASPGHGSSVPSIHFFPAPPPPTDLLAGWGRSEALGARPFLPVRNAFPLRRRRFAPTRAGTSCPRIRCGRIPAASLSDARRHEGCPREHPALLHLPGSVRTQWTRVTAPPSQRLNTEW